ncbi:Dbf4 [Kluyveromyces lactis]|nr:Dbf4 [Kluyveromyces lactis]
MAKNTRSPLKESNPNTMGNHIHNPKKRSLDLLELEQSNRQKQRTLRTIEGAIAHAPNALLKTVQGGTTNTFNINATSAKSGAPVGVNDSVAASVSASVSAGGSMMRNSNEHGIIGGNGSPAIANAKAQTQRLSNKELIDWQNNWKKIMKRDTFIYFDCPEVANDNRKDVLRRAFSTLGAKVKQFFDHEVTIVITSRKITNYSQLPDTDILQRAHKRGYMKIWTLEKAARFLTNMDVDLKEMERDSISGKSIPASNLLNLLESEKLFGSNERDPKTKRDDLHYFKHPHVYLFDLAQINAPLITLEWKAQDINNKKKHIYPTIKPGSFGRCPFQGDETADELQPRRIIKRYKRDKANESYAMKLRLLYQTSAEPATLSSSANSDYEGDDAILSFPDPSSNEPIILPYQNVYNNSGAQYNKLVSSMSRFKQPKLPRGDTFDDDELPYGNGTGAIGGTGSYKNKFQQEIRASGVQSVDANSNGNATVGNGLEPAKASNLNKDLLSLKKMVIERKSLLSASTTSNSADIAGSVNSGKLHNHNTAASGVNQTNLTSTVSKQQLPALTPQRLHQPIGRQTAGYCENCKVKYDSLDAHVSTERHIAFAKKDEHFQGVDSMIQCVQQFRDINSA